MERRATKTRAARPWGRAIRSAWVPLAAAAIFCVASVSTDAMAQPANQAQPSAQPAPTTQPADANAGDVDAIKRLIQEKVQQAKTNAGNVTPNRVAPQRPAEPAKTPREPTQPPKARATGERGILQEVPAPVGGKSAKQGKEAGCGSKASGVDLTPPPPDQPQPRWACESETVQAEPLWAGKDATFLFKIRNEGEGVLNINLKGG